MGRRVHPVRVGAASSKDGLVLRRSWARTLAASVARSVMGTMSVDFMVTGGLVVDPAEKVLTMRPTPDRIGGSANP